MLSALSPFLLAIGVSVPMTGAPAADDLAVLDRHGQVRAEFGESARFYADDAALDLKLEAWGYEGCLTPVAEVQPGRVGDAIVYDRGDVREWYVDLKNGIEQCFLIRKPPAGRSADGTWELELRLQLGRGWVASVAEDGQSVVLCLGEQALFYSGLAVFDAGGQQLDAGIRANDNGLSILVDVGDASYPIFVDPVIQTETQSLYTQKSDHRVSVTQNFAVVGVENWNSDTGRVYVYERASSGWSYIIDFEASDALGGRRFGSDVDVDGNTILVGAGGAHAGYFFDWNGSSWIETQKVSQLNASQFGEAVDLDGDLAVVGAFWATGLASSTGAAWLYDRTGSTWSEATKLSASDGQVNDLFGYAVAIIDNDNVAISANGDDDLGASSGSVYVFTRFGNFWSQTGKLRASDGTSADYFGDALSADEGRLLVGAHHAGLIGACYLFEHDGSGWNEVQKFTPSDGFANDEYGFSCSISGAIVAIGAPGRDVFGSARVGKAYVYEETGPGTWMPKFSLGPSSPVAGADLGTDVSASGAYLIVGTDSTSGTVYSYDLHNIELIDYCTGKANSQGCVPYVDYVGKPLSLTSTSDFVIRAFDVINNKTGLLFYSVVGRASLPFQGATLCVSPPLQRTPIQFSAGNPPPDDCSGVMAFDSYAWIQSGFDPALVPGTQVNAQFWYRDPPVDSFMVGLSNAIEFGIHP